MSVDHDLIGVALERYRPNETWSLVTEQLGNDNDIAIIELADGERLVLRLPHAEHGYMGVRTADDFRFEVELQEYFRGHGLPMPRVHRSVDGNTVERIAWNDDVQTVIVNEFVAGEHPDQFSRERIASVATLMANMHTLAPQFQFVGKRGWPGTLIEMTDDRIRRIQLLNIPASLAAASTELTEIIAAYQPRVQAADLSTLPRGAIHGDLTPANLFFHRDTIAGLIDFDDSRDSYFIEDIVKSLLFNFGEPPARLLEDQSSVRHFLASYEAVRPLSETERRALPLFFEARCIYEVTKYFFRLERDAQTYQDRIQRYLDRRREYLSLFCDPWPR